MLEAALARRAARRARRWHKPASVRGYCSDREEQPHARGRLWHPRRGRQQGGGFNAADVANIAKSNPYIQRLIEDADLRENVQKAIESGKSAYGRLVNGKAPHRAIVEDKKLQKDLREASRRSARRRWR